MPPDCVLTQLQGLCWCGAQAVACLLLWAVCGKLCRCTCMCVHQFGTCSCQYMIACVLYCGLLHTAGEHSCGSAAGVGLWGWAVLGRQQVRWPTPPTMHACHAAKQPTSATHQHPRTALQHRPPNMFPTPLGVVFQPLLTALHLEVSVLSCTLPKVARTPVSSGAITLPRLLLSAPAQWLRVPHHPGCHEKSLDFSPRLAGFQAQTQTSTG